MIRQAGREKLEKQRSVEEKNEFPSGSPNAVCTGMKPHQTKQIRAQSLLPARQPWNLSRSLSLALSLSVTLSPPLSLFPFALHFMVFFILPYLDLVLLHPPPFP